MAKDYEANDPAARLANIKRKVAKLEYISTPEVEGDGVNDNCGNLDNAIHVLGHKNAEAKLCIMVTKGMPKKIKIQACNSMSSLSATSTSKRSGITIPVQVHFNNSDLPLDLHKDQKWKREVIPMLILWARNQEDAFNIAKQDISGLYRRSCQSYTPYSRIWQVAFFPVHPWFLLPQHDCSLEGLPPISVQQLLLSSHLTATKGYIQVPTLDTSSLAKHGVVGALGLCVAALSHGLNLVRSGDIELKSPINVKDGIAKVAMRFVQTPVKYNMASGKDSKTVCMFSDQNWGAPMRKFMGAAKRRSIAQLQAIIEFALASLVIGQELDPELLSDAGSDNNMCLADINCTSLLLIRLMEQNQHYFK
ncbi:hypothetical protein F5J12DRAFT_787660 [Pisolithus orientalis]|uniref:uncharacterized protein n=1 Tax=Pisolithus orientalis TaxID=936130 RepID=UPI0022242512|nr:uncharacterized protein F5J12DRAFT_787660 [Pisolithus orientalis]KAI5984110.1 hypothetical protein F5J12DRAFT_787660 [Pisolithus orientalis]